LAWLACTSTSGASEVETYAGVRLSISRDESAPGGVRFQVGPEVRWVDPSFGGSLRLESALQLMVVFDSEGRGWALGVRPELRLEHRSLDASYIPAFLVSIGETTAKVRWIQPDGMFPQLEGVGVQQVANFVLELRGGTQGMQEGVRMPLADLVTSSGEEGVPSHRLEVGRGVSDQVAPKPSLLRGEPLKLEPEFQPRGVDTPAR
jgi:hypothetical protein